MAVAESCALPHRWQVGPLLHCVGLLALSRCSAHFRACCHIGGTSPHIQYGCISGRQIKHQIPAYTMWLYMQPISGCQIPAYTLQLYKWLMGAQNFNKIITSYKNS